MTSWPIHGSIGNLRHKLARFFTAEISLSTLKRPISLFIRTRKSRLEQRLDGLNRQSRVLDLSNQLHEASFRLGVLALPTRFSVNSKPLPRLRELLISYWTDEELRPRLVATLEDFQRNTPKWVGQTTLRTDNSTMSSRQLGG